MRYKLTIEYDGTNFSGWQNQVEANSIQSEIESALKKIFNDFSQLTVAGRTDAGVHASGQVAHFDTQKISMNEYQIMSAVNFHLRPNPIAITKVERVSDEFHARFSAKKRRYTYKIINRKAHLTLDRELYWHVPQELNIEKMQAQAKFLVGRHNFNSFRCSECGANDPVKTLDSIEIQRDGERIFIHLSARSFLHKQVRIIVGTLVEIGRGKGLDINRILKQENRIYAGPTAPPCGLYLVSVYY